MYLIQKHENHPFKEWKQYISSILSEAVVFEGADLLSVSQKLYDKVDDKCLYAKYKA